MLPAPGITMALLTIPSTMQYVFTPRPGDREVTSYHPNGLPDSVAYFREGIPANGWSRKEWWENGNLKQADCFSHQLLIESVTFDENGNKQGHLIYSHRLKTLVNKPIVTNIVRHNTVSGCAHMGFYFRHLPAISAFIGAAYEEESLEKAYRFFLEKVSADEEIDTSEMEFTWTLRGTHMTFMIRFEKYEMLYQWGLFAKTEANYATAKAFMEQLPR